MYRLDDRVDADFDNECGGAVRIGIVAAAAMAEFFCEEPGAENRNDISVLRIARNDTSPSRRITNSASRSSHGVSASRSSHKREGRNEFERRVGNCRHDLLECV